MTRLAPSALLAATIALLLLGGTPAVAVVDDEPEPLVYEGVRTMFFTAPTGVQRAGDPADRVITLVCDGGVCLVSGVDLVNHQDIPIELVNGRASYSFPAFGTACDAGRTRAHESTFEATPTQFLATIELLPQGPDNCGGENEVGTVRAGTTWVYEIPYVSGDPCVIDDSCPESSSTAAPAASAADEPTEPRSADTPSVLGGLPTAAEVSTPRNFAWAAVGTIVLVLLVAFPTQLFNSAAETATARLGAWWRARRGSSAPVRMVTLTGLPAAAGGVAAAALISAFVDPAFGLDLASARTLLSMLVGFAITVVVGWFALIAIVRRTHPTTTVAFEFSPLTLLIVVGAVLFSRLTAFEPGLVFGLVAGVVFGGVLATAEKARVAITTLGYSFVLAIIAWLAYSALSLVSEPNGFVVFVQEALSTIAIAGIAALPVMLLPVRGLVGRTVWEWKRWIWAVAYGLGLFGFLLVLLPMPFSWDNVTASIWTWAGLYVAYALLAVGVWLTVERPWRRTPAATTEEP